MPGVETVRDFVNQRLTAAAEEIFGVFERTIAEYEELLCRCKEENERKQKLLDDVQLRFHRADNQQLSETPEEVPSEQQEWNPTEDTELPHLKEEDEEQWSNQEDLYQAYTIKFPFSSVPVKTEDDEEKPQFSELHKIKIEGMKTGADGEDCRGPDQAWDLGPERYLHAGTQDKTGDFSESETGDSEDWRVPMENDSGLICVEKVDNGQSDSDKKSHSCSQCSRTFPRKCHLATHMRTHQKEEPFSCSDCGERFHHKIHLNSHMFLHTGERPLSSSECDQPFHKKSTLINHMLTHGQEKHFSCSRCDKKFSHKSHLTNHMLMHTGEKPFGCSECDKKFNQKSNLNKHMLMHTGDKPFSCPECDKKFNQKSNLTKHMVVHTGEKPFGCPQCDKKFSHRSYLISHMVIHTGEKPFSCELCDQKFSWVTQVKKHKCTGGQTS